MASGSVRLSDVRFAAAICATAIGSMACAGDAAAAAQNKPVPVWAKICEPVPIAGLADRGPNPVKSGEKKVCDTQHVSFGEGTIALRVSVSVREIEGQDKKLLLIQTPPSTVRPVGLALQFDDENDEAKFVKLHYDDCIPVGCISESEATPELIDRISRSKTLNVLSLLPGYTVQYRIPTDQFASAFAGEPVDPKTYMFHHPERGIHLSEAERAVAKKRAMVEVKTHIERELAAGAGSGDGTTGKGSSPTTSLTGR